jgi:hypothetical protein
MKLFLSQRNIKYVYLFATSDPLYIQAITRPSPFRLFGVKIKTRISTRFTAKQLKQSECQNIVLLVHTTLGQKRVCHVTGYFFTVLLMQHQTTRDRFRRSSIIQNGTPVNVKDRIRAASVNVIHLC